jgi:aryl-alcohol dehydrogenase-like predicted oxidoreductase
MQRRTFGQNLEVSAIGLGCMGMSSSLPPFPDEKDLVRLLRAAVERGFIFFDTAQVCALTPTKGLSAKPSRRYARRS